jgi:hypothetical protein
MDRSVTLTSPHIPAHIVELLGTAPLLEDEDPQQYQALLSEIARTVKPANVMEWLWVKDIVDLTWDTIRYRWLKMRWIQHNNLGSPDLSTDRSFGGGMSEFDATTSAFASLNLIEQMQASAELRRNNALNEIEARRASLGQALRKTSDQVIESQATQALAAAS